MDLNSIQTLFYALGSIFFAILIVFLVIFIISLYIFYKRLSKTARLVNGQINRAKDLYDHKEKYILKFVTKGSSTIVDSISNFFSKNKK